MAELGPREQWDVTQTELKDVSTLVKEIRRALPGIQKGKEHEKRADAQKMDNLTDWENVEVDVGKEGGEEEDDGDGEGLRKKQTEDEEADDVIARIMAELEISKKYGPPSPEPDDDSDSDGNGGVESNTKQTPAQSKSDPEKEEEANPKNGDEAKEKDDLALPSAPSSVPQTSEQNQALEDALAARFAALSSSSPSQPQTNSLGLPSAPSFHPAQKPPKVQAKLDEDETETWCCICADDAELRCLGCDGDLFCQPCWMEGHRGEAAHIEERMHKAVLYSKKKKEAAA
ncbi:hypothetical protein DM02DRAFT_615699 [Periconia macrospinosa]|uniref:Uncharacterized protein n=1 Tax=Periconia macrospinosa TaxID=97972 RepID=A0A2V1DKY0_9PLEO|nr:hypothetical protein DM02DRAFT_615699 [Periconia macrospinosa]